MIPELSLRIDTTLRALIESVIPAIKPEAKQAIEQAYLAVAHLRMIAEQFDKTFEFQLVELVEFSELARQLIECTSHIPEIHGSVGTEAARLVAMAETITVLPIPKQREVADLIRSLKSSVDLVLKMVFERDDASIKKKAFQLVMQRAGPQIERERVWRKRPDLIWRRRSCRLWRRFLRGVILERSGWGAQTLPMAREWRGIVWDA